MYHVLQGQSIIGIVEPLHVTKLIDCLPSTKALRVAKLFPVAKIVILPLKLSY
jgi:hypothetical protein